MSRGDAHRREMTPAWQRVFTINKLFRPIAESINHHNARSVTSLALSCHALCERSLSVLWSEQRGLVHLLKLLPQNCWQEISGPGGTLVFELLTDAQIDMVNMERLEYYSRFIQTLTWDTSTDLRISPTLLQFFSKLPSDYVLLPQLLSLQWWSRRPDYADLAIPLLSPSLEKLMIYAYCGHYPSILAAAGLRCRNLDHIQVSSALSLSPNTLTKFISESDLSKLHTFISIDDPSQNGILALASLPSLRTLSFYANSALFSNTPFPNNSFPALRWFYFHVDVLSDSTLDFLIAITSPYLQNVKIRAYAETPAHLLTAHMHALSHHRLTEFRLELTCNGQRDLEMYQSVLRMPDDGDTSAIHLLLPLFSMTSLETLAIEMPDLVVNHSLINAIAHSFPRLSCLSLIALHHAPLDALFPLVQVASRLKTLEIWVDGENVPPLPISLKSIAPLEVLTIGPKSKISESAHKDISAYVRAVFPSLRHLLYA